MSQPYSVRESKRAKYVSLKISSIGRLEVVVPLGFDRKTIPDIVARKRHWIDRVQRKLADQQVPTDQSVSGPYPTQLNLLALAQTWQVEYRATSDKALHLTVLPHQQLLLRGATEDWDLCREALKRWLTQIAQRQLVPWLRELSTETGLEYQGVSVRSPKTRWGSCSAQHRISLNSKLLFLNPAIVRYVLIHELCHTVHFNHSSAFWNLVGYHEPRYLSLKEELKCGHYQVPRWIE